MEERKKKILVADDSVLTNRITSDILKRAGYEVINAVDGEEALELIQKERPDLLLTDIVMPKLSGLDVCKVIRDDPAYNLMPIIILTTKGQEEDKLKGLELGADDYIVKPFNEKELLIRVKNLFKRIDRNRLANPLTGLHGNLDITMEMTRRLDTGERFAVLYIDLDNFKAFNDYYGFSRGDKVIKLLADIIVEVCHKIGNTRDFVGHIGGDDFVVITTIDKMELLSQEIINTFDSSIRLLYNEEDLKRGYIVTRDRRGKEMKYPVITVSIGIVVNEDHRFKNPLEIGEVAAEVKAVAKSIEGKSNYFIDRRRG
ncbi:MAG: response regulator [Thermoanaerobacteraceae bacterium]|nr:response regulator [Thermoanaerobacteraceae bacterium]